MPFIRYTAKKILMITALSNTLAPMVKTYIRAGVIIESVIDCVRWASLACPGAFYIYENFLKKFLPEPNIGHYPFGTMDEREIEISSICSFLICVCLLFRPSVVARRLRSSCAFW